MPVKVTPSNGNEITVHYYTCEKDPYEVSLDGGVLTVKYKSNILFNIGNWFSGMFRVFSNSNPSVEVIVPAEYAGALQLDTSNSPLNVSGLTAAGEIHIDTSNSPIEVSNVSATLLNANTSNAAVNVSGLTSAGEVRINTSNSHIEADNVSAALVTAQTSNGAVTLDKVIVSGTVDMKSSNGTLTARQVAAKDKLLMDTSNGRIAVEQVISAAIRLNSSNGSIFGSVEGKRSDYTISSGTSNGDNNLGDGGKGQFMLTVNTSNGNIDIRFLGE
jgi:DUF4097 and DUF4098 domain-containing protein YvlB